MSSNVSAKQKNIINQIIKLIYLEGEKSIPEISKIINLTIPTVNGIISDLVEQEIISDLGPGNSSGGRKPNLYGMHGKGGFTVIVDVNHQYFRIAIYNLLNENISGTKHYDIPLENNEKYIDIVTEKIKSFIDHNKIEKNKILGAGFFFPGLVNSESGINYSYLHYDGIVVRDLFAEKLSLPVVVENDTRASTIGEFRFGKAKDKLYSLNVFIDEGIGLGIISNGQIYRGKSGFSGEFGHIQIKPDGPLCYCGKQGCLETVASGRAIVDMISAAIEKGELSHLKNMMSLKDDALSIEMIIKATKLGDQFSIESVSQIGEYMGKGIAMLLHIFNPEMVVVSGKLSKAEKFLLNPLEQAINKYTMSQINSDVEIVLSELGGKASMLGMSSLVIENTFRTI